MKPPNIDGSLLLYFFSVLLLIFVPIFSNYCLFLAFIFHVNIRMKLTLSSYYPLLYLLINYSLKDFNKTSIHLILLIQLLLSLYIHLQKLMYCRFWTLLSQLLPPFTCNLKFFAPMKEKTYGRSLIHLLVYTIFKVLYLGLYL